MKKPNKVRWQFDAKMAYVIGLSEDAGKSGSSAPRR